MINFKNYSGLLAIPAIAAFAGTIQFYDTYYRQPRLAAAILAFRQGKGEATCYYPGRALPGATTADDSLKAVPTSALPHDGPVGAYFLTRIEQGECEINPTARPTASLPAPQWIHVGGAG